MTKVLLTLFLFIPMYLLLSVWIYVWTLDAAFGVQLVDGWALFWGTAATLMLQIVAKMFFAINQEDLKR